MFSLDNSNFGIFIQLPQHSVVPVTHWPRISDSPINNARRFINDFYFC